MATTSPRPLWPVLVSLAATALLSFAAGMMVTAWALSGEASAARAGRPDAGLAVADDPGRLRLALVPAEPIGAAEAALLAPEIFPAAVDLGAAPPPSAGLFTVQLGTFLRPELAESAQRNAEALGLAATTRLVVDGHGRAWYSVQAGRYGDRLSAALAARSFDGAHVVALSLPPSAWSRG